MADLLQEREQALRGGRERPPGLAHDADGAIETAELHGTRDEPGRDGELERGAWEKRDPRDGRGAKGYESHWFAAYVPVKTPPAVGARLHDLRVAATKGAAAKQFYEGTWTEPLVSTPEELAKFQAAESQKWGKIIKAASIQPE